eukprot:gnl/Hemi2/7283_TR2480_c0_g1_i1.p1 gnl/Hemi2/7283_TR2480_c0_g1~~gnl/Hemi2/7283_TR2480_c0_g1_i1.p1  ORF type:complete len:159 (+),score=31.41 gnl/Hemi2/7283_TR2480_c0_g1_i1:50-526(+)
MAVHSLASHGRLVAESSFDVLYLEVVNKLREREPGLEALHAKLERLGFQVGQRLAEKYTQDRPRFSDNVEIIKFICKEFWIEIFKKQVDNLKTNHKGTFHLFDEQFRWVTRLSDNDAAATYLIFPCGLIRGALANLGLASCVTADVTVLPKCFFTIKL